uniref:Uncharacterized protein n=1 Tax=Nelumbo nucifera TaxID=4432 RepID=A0A822ZMT5_NELNU|nr:TPA_asm: hypothetical protein HUJ06_004010 [Nelumbo nucifera]
MRIQTTTITNLPLFNQKHNKDNESNKLRTNQQKRIYPIKFYSLLNFYSFIF